MSVLGIGFVASRDKQIEKLQDQLFDMASTLRNTQKEYQQCFTDWSNADLKIRELRENLEISENENRGYKAHIDRLTSELALTEKVVLTLREEAEAKDEEIAKLSEAIGFSEEEIDAAKVSRDSVIQSLRSQLDATKSELDKSNKDLEEAVAKVNSLLDDKEGFWLTEERLRRAEKALVGYREDEVKLRSKISSLETKVRRGEEVANLFLKELGKLVGKESSPKIVEAIAKEDPKEAQS